MLLSAYLTWLFIDIKYAIFAKTLNIWMYVDIIADGTFLWKRSRILGIFSKNVYIYVCTFYRVTLI